MHIQKAKQQIKNAIIAYLTKDQYGHLRIPVSKQRPIFLVGAPGIGKTAIVEQIAQELDLGFVSYAMTHHTRQSALGLPFIVEKDYGGKTYSVSEYTMSEIIASVYEEMEKTGKKEGILFLDEINCVSETLAPSMLQFLQYKTFGRHEVPQGWIVVTAGNPPEYNDAVRPFDLAMLDRLKKVEVEPDFEVWKAYALQNHVHPVILSYLTVKPQFFYRITTTLDDKSFVTARAWDDLSQMITLYEENELAVDRDLIGQYVQDEEIARDFANYYDLFFKYRSDYQVEEILAGSVSEDIIHRAKDAKFDERLSLLSLILTSLDERIARTVMKEDVLRTLIPEVSALADPEVMAEKIAFYEKKSQATDTREHVELACAVLDELKLLQDKEDKKEVLRSEAAALKQDTQKGQDMLANVFTFFENAFGTGQEMLILVSELTVRPAASQFIYRHGCEKYYAYNKQLLFEDTRKDLMDRIDALDLPEIL